MTATGHSPDSPGNEQHAAGTCHAARCQRLRSWVGAPIRKTTAATLRGWARHSELGRSPPGANTVDHWRRFLRCYQRRTICVGGLCAAVSHSKRSLTTTNSGPSAAKWPHNGIYRHCPAPGPRLAAPPSPLRSDANTSAWRAGSSATRQTGHWPRLVLRGPPAPLRHVSCPFRMNRQVRERCADVVSGDVAAAELSICYPSRAAARRFSGADRL